MKIKEQFSQFLSYDSGLTAAVTTLVYGVPGAASSEIRYNPIKFKEQIFGLIPYFLTQTASVTTLAYGVPPAILGHEQESVEN